MTDRVFEIGYLGLHLKQHFSKFLAGIFEASSEISSMLFKYFFSYKTQKRGFIQVQPDQSLKLRYYLQKLDKS